MSKTAQAIKSGVVMGGTAILSAVNGLTPHMAGAIDIMVVQQPDGTLKCSPFYVRFGKYTPMRSKDKKVQIFVNGEEACFSMHLGAYGQAYFAAETMEIVSDADDELLTGMMSPSSGYSSDEDDSTPYANASMLSAVQQEVAKLQAAKAAADAASAAAAGGDADSGAFFSPDAAATGAAAGEDERASADGVQFVDAAGDSGSGGGGGSQPGSSSTGLGGSRSGARQQGSSNGRVSLSHNNAQSGIGSESGSASDTEASSSSSSSSSSSLSDLPGPEDVAAALQQGLAAAGHAPPAAGITDGQQPLALPPGLPPIATSASSNGNVSRQGSSRRRSRQHVGRRVLQVSGDGAADDPARARLQDMLLDNRYSIKMQSGESFAADQQQQQQQPRRRHSRSLSPAKQGGVAHQQQQQQQHDPQQPQPQEAGLQVDAEQQQQQQQQQLTLPIRHVGFQVPPSPDQPPSKGAADAGTLAGATAAAAANGLPQVHVSELPVLLDPAASYSMQEVSEAPGLTERFASCLSEGAFSTASFTGLSGSPAAAAAGADGGAGSAGRPSITLPSQQSDVPPQQQQVQQQEEQLVSPTRASLLSSSLKAQQQPDTSTQQPQQQQQQQLQQREQEEPSQLDELPQHQQQQQSGLGHRQQSQTAVQPQQAAAAEPAGTQGGVPSGSSSPASSRNAADADVDATAILDDAPAAIPAGWTPGAAPQPSTPQPAAAATATTTSSSSSTDTQLQGPVGAAAAGGAAAVGAAAEAVQALRSAPVSMPGSFGASPPVDSGYLGDSEPGALLGTSFEGATPRRAAATAALAADGVSGAGPLALGLAGFQLSLCGDLLRPGITAAEAQQVFETRRLSGQAWSERGVSLLGEPDLVVKIGGSLYSWQVAAPMVVGMLAFGGKWDSLLGLDPTGMYPIKVAEDHAAHAAKKSSASSSWRLWPFTGWRDPASASKHAQQQQQGSSPSQALPPAAAAVSASSAALQPSGGSFTNLKALLGPGSKSAPDRSSYSAAGTAGGSGGPGQGVSGGAGPDAAADRAASFMSTASSPTRAARRKHIILIRKTLTPTSEQLTLLPLRPGANTITFRAGGAADLTAYIYLLRWNTRLVVSDVDGTITRSDLLGHVLPTLGVDWSHPGITQLFHNIARNGYQIMFLSSRAIAQANITREYLHTLVQNDFKMPSGPVIISPHGLLPSLYREIVVRRPHEFKIACLQDIRALFPAEWNPFYAGFGNRDTDELAYREVGVPLSRTFTINPKGQIQKASTAVQSSTWSSLSAINDLVDEMFPALQRLQHTNSSIVSRGLQSVYTSFTETLELAAALGAIQGDTVAAAYAQAQRRRESSSSAGGASPDAVAAAAAAAATAAFGSDGSMAGVASKRTDGQVPAQQQATLGSSPGNGFLAIAAAAAVAAAAADGGGMSVQSPRAGDALGLENVGPAREEYNDLHFWRPTVYFDIGDELAAVEAARPQPAS